MLSRLTEHSVMERNKAQRTDSTYILPILLQQWNEEINTHLNILEYLLLLHSNIAHSNSHAKHLLQLELYHSLSLINFRLYGFLMSNKSWKLPYISKKGINTNNNAYPTPPKARLKSLPTEDSLSQLFIKWNAVCTFKLTHNIANKLLTQKVGRMNELHMYNIYYLRTIYIIP